MYQYNNSGYVRSQPASVENVTASNATPHRHSGTGTITGRRGDLYGSSRDFSGSGATTTTTTTGSGTVGIGYYGVRKTTESSDSGVRSQLTSPGNSSGGGREAASGTGGLGSPDSQHQGYYNIRGRSLPRPHYNQQSTPDGTTLTTPTTTMDHSQLWNNNNSLHADVDLSPRVVPGSSSSGHDTTPDSRQGSSSRVKSPVRPLSDGSIVDSITRNRRLMQQLGSNRGQDYSYNYNSSSRAPSALLYHQDPADRSTTESTDHSDVANQSSLSRPDRTLSYSAPAMDSTSRTPQSVMDTSGRTPQHSVMSLREKWERSRQARVDDMRSPANVYDSSNKGRTTTTGVNSSTPNNYTAVSATSADDVITTPTSPLGRDLRSPALTLQSRPSPADTLNSRSMVFSSTYLDHSAQSTMERADREDDPLRYTGTVGSSFRRDPVTHRKLLPNGVAHPLRDHDDGLRASSRRSLSLSRVSSLKSILSHQGKVTRYGTSHGVQNSLVSMCVASLLALVTCILALQLLLRVAAPSVVGVPGPESVLRSGVSYVNVSDVVVALTCISVMLDLCCLMTCAMQGYFAAKLLKCSQGEERAFRYLKECSPTRFIAIVGFFISIPLYFFALMLYILMEYRSTAAIVSVVVLTIGVSFLVSMVVHSTYAWLTEKSAANNDGSSPPRDGANYSKNNGRRRTRVINGELTNQNELSTLV